MFAIIGTEVKLIGFAFYFLGMWFGIGGLLAFIGGWFGLSKIYRDNDPSQTLQYIAKTINVGGVSYGRCINASVTTSGIYLRIFFIFRFLHPPLFIPWLEIKSVASKKWFFFSSYYVRTRQSGTTICFYGKLGESIFREWHEQSNKSLPARFARPDNK